LPNERNLGIKKRTIIVVEIFTGFFVNKNKIHEGVVEQIKNILTLVLKINKIEYQWIVT